MAGWEEWSTRSRSLCSTVLVDRRRSLGEYHTRRTSQLLLQPPGWRDGGIVLGSGPGELRDETALTSVV
jgi:hypothetical protein